MGRVTSVSYSTSAVLAYTYDTKDRVSQRKTSANGITVDSDFSYNDSGQLVTFSAYFGEGSGYYAEFTNKYDTLKRLTQTLLYDESSIEYTYVQGENNQAISLIETLKI